jgi:hypothetical protein
MDSSDPDWTNFLDVVNCSRSLVRDVARQMVYICPDTGGAYTHERAKYFGPYADKNVESIYEIRAVVAIQANFSGGCAKWKNVEAEDAALVEEATQKIRAAPHRLEEIKKHGMLVFLLGNHARTNFYKATKFGLRGSKTYFRNVGKGCANSTDLASNLKNRSWADFD